MRPVRFSEKARAIFAWMNGWRACPKQSLHPITSWACERQSLFLHWTTLEPNPPSPYHMPLSNDSWADELASTMSRATAFVGFDSIGWRPMSSARDSIERNLTEGSDHHLVWHHSYGPGLEGNALKTVSTLQSRETNRVYTNIKTMAAHTLVEMWTKLRWREVIVDDGGQSRLATKLQSSFEDSPVEDGMEHQSQWIIAKHCDPQITNGSWLAEGFLYGCLTVELCCICTAVPGTSRWRRHYFMARRTSARWLDG